MEKKLKVFICINCFKICLYVLFIVYYCACKLIIVNILGINHVLLFIRKSCVFYFLPG